MEEPQLLIRTISVDVNLSPVFEKQFHDVQRPRLGAVVERCVALDRLPVDVGSDLDQVVGDSEMTLVAGDHETGVSVAVGDLNICKIGKKRLKNWI